MAVQYYQLIANDWTNLEFIINDLTTRIIGQTLNPTSDPTFASLTLTDLTDHSMVLGSSTDALSSLGAATNGQLIIGSTGADPVLAALTGTANQIISTPGAGSITLSTPQDIHTGASPTFAGLTLTNAAVIGSDSVVFQPNANSTTFLQVKNAAGNDIITVDTTNRWIGFNKATPGYPIDAERTFTALSGTPSVINTLAILYPASASAVYATAIKGRTAVTGGSNVTNATTGGFFEVWSNNSATLSDVRGVSMSIVNAGTGTMGSTYGALLIHQNTSTGAITTQRGGLMSIRNTSTGAITGGLGLIGEVLQTGGGSYDFAYGLQSTTVNSNGSIWGWRGLDVRLANTGGTITHSHAIYVGDITSGTQTNQAYGLYISDADARNYIAGSMGIGEVDPETLLELTHAEPYITLYNNTHEDTDGGRESRIIAKGEQSGGEETALGMIEFSHDGTSDNQLSKIVLSVNTGAGLAEAIEIGSDLKTTFAGLTVTNACVIGSNSAVFQPAANSVGFFDVRALDADPVLTVDTTNKRVGVHKGTPLGTLHMRNGNAGVTPNSAGNIMVLESGGDNGFSIITPDAAAAYWMHGTPTGTNAMNFLYSFYNAGSPYMAWYVGATLRMSVNATGLGVHEQFPSTAIEVTHTQPYLTLHNNTHEDTDGGGESRWIGKRHDGLGNETACAQIEMSHDGTGANNQLGKIVLSVNTGAGLAEAIEIGSDQLVTVNNFVRSASTNYRRYYHIPLYGAAPGASGATFVPPDGNVTGGWQLNASTEYIYGEFDVHADWDGASNPTLEIYFSINVNNSGGAVDDVAAGTVIFYYKGAGDTATKTQTVNGSVVVGQAAQYTQFKIEIPLDWDLADNVLDVGDEIGCRFNLDTGTSDIDDVTVESVSAYYNTTHSGIESGDV